MAYVSYYTDIVRDEFISLYSQVDDTSDELQPSVIALADGGFAVAYGFFNTASGNDYSIILDIYEADGSKRGVKYNVVDTFVDMETVVDPTLAQLADGRIIVTWTQTNGAGPGLRYAIVNPADNTTIVADGLLPATDANDFASRVVGLSDGGWVIAKQDNHSASDQDADLIFYNNLGVKTAEVALNNNSSSDERNPVITLLNNGYIAVAYEREMTNGGGTFGIAVEIYNQAGQAIRAPIDIDTTGTQNLRPAITTLQGGGFAIAYEDNQYGQPGYSVAFMNEAGDVLGVVRGDANVAEPDYNVAITTLVNGLVLVTHTSDGHADIRSDMFDPITRTRISQSNIVDFQNDVQDNSSTASLLNGNIVTVWADYNSAIEDGNTDPGDAHVSLIIQKAIRVTQMNGENITGDAISDWMIGSDQIFNDVVEMTFNDTMNGAGGDDTLRAAGGQDSLIGGSGNDILQGEDGNDTMEGGTGIDTLTGGLGNDTYIDPTGDTIVEAANAGTDTVLSSASFDLTNIANVERLFLTGTSAIDATGNALNNQFIGNDKINVINGRDGNDTINSGGGADTIFGGNGADRLIGGLQRDKIVPGTDTARDDIVYSLIGESTGQTRDVIMGLDLNNEDKLDLPGAVSSIAVPVSGALSLATFNTNLISVFTAAALPVGSAALFTPTSGDLVNPNMVYLIVDANGIAGYQANQDWVFQLENHTGTLDTSDFI